MSQKPVAGAPDHPFGDGSASMVGANSSPAGEAEPTAPNRSARPSEQAAHGAILTVSWDDDKVMVELRLTCRNWSRVLRRLEVRLRGRGYEYEDEFFWDYWTFEGGLNGGLLVTYEDEGGIGFDGSRRLHY